MEFKRLCTMVHEIFKTLENVNPAFVEDIINYSPKITHKKVNLFIHTQNTTKFGNTSLKTFGEKYETHCLNILNLLLHF